MKEELFGRFECSSRIKLCCNFFSTLFFLVIFFPTAKHYFIACVIFQQKALIIEFNLLSFLPGNQD
jgi:hypothetical protein